MASHRDALEDIRERVERAIDLVKKEEGKAALSELQVANRLLNELRKELTSG